MDINKLENLTEFLIEGGISKAAKAGCFVCKIDGKKCNHHYNLLNIFGSLEKSWKCRQSGKFDKYYPDEYNLKCSRMLTVKQTF